MKHSVRIQIFFIFAEVDLDESNNVSLEEQVDLLDDYTPLDPAYLPAGLGEDDNKVRIVLTAIISDRLGVTMHPAQPDL